MWLFSCSDCMHTKLRKHEDLYNFAFFICVLCALATFSFAALVSDGLVPTLPWTHSWSVHVPKACWTSTIQSDLCDNSVSTWFKALWVAATSFIFSHLFLLCLGDQPSKGDLSHPSRLKTLAFLCFTSAALCTCTTSLPLASLPSSANSLSPIFLCSLASEDVTSLYIAVNASNLIQGLPSCLRFLPRPSLRRCYVNSWGSLLSQLRAPLFNGSLLLNWSKPKDVCMRWHLPGYLRCGLVWKGFARCEQTGTNTSALQILHSAGCCGGAVGKK